jgi:hypothetical protein
MLSNTVYVYGEFSSIENHLQLFNDSLVGVSLNKDGSLASLPKLKDLLTGCVDMQLARMTANLATGFCQNGLLFGKDGNPASDGNVYILNG